MNAVDTSKYKAEVEKEISENPIIVYTKGTKEFPRCGFTMRLKDVFTELNVPFEFQDVLEQPEKRMFLSEFCEWPTLPKVFIKGEFCGGTDIILEMIENGELEPMIADLRQ
jgi:monothiol glutaredoxin